MNVQRGGACKPAVKTTTAEAVLAVMQQRPDRHVGPDGKEGYSIEVFNALSAKGTRCEHKGRCCDAHTMHALPILQMRQDHEERLAEAIEKG